jgi:hypothetical protein
MRQSVQGLGCGRNGRGSFLIDITEFLCPPPLEPTEILFSEYRVFILLEVNHPGLEYGGLAQLVPK